MPWAPSQHRLFEAAAHDPKIAQSKGIPQAKAAQMASEGIKSKPQRLAQTLKNMTKGKAP